MHFIVDKRLKRGRLTVADATNVQADKRAALLHLAANHHRPAIAIVLDLPQKLCQERNKARARKVPYAAIAGQAKQLREARWGARRRGVLGNVRVVLGGGCRRSGGRSRRPESLEGASDGSVSGNPLAHKLEGLLC